MRKYMERAFDVMSATISTAILLPSFLIPLPFPLSFRFPLPLKAIYFIQLLEDRWKNANEEWARNESDKFH